MAGCGRDQTAHQVGVCAGMEKLVGGVDKVDKNPTVNACRLIPKGFPGKNRNGSYARILLRQPICQHLLSRSGP